MVLAVNTSIESSPAEEVEPEQVHTTIRLERRLFDELRRVARLNDRSVSAEIRQALRDHLRER
jgi:hypothetical protein